MIERVNGHRASKGVGPLESNLALWLKAGAWAIHMADQDAMSHSVLSDGNQYPYRAAAENVAIGSGVSQVFDAWVSSGPHRKNIENPSFNYTAVGIVERNGKVYAVQEFMAL